nr:unnamed protein product [Digitaria exilis]
MAKPGCRETCGNLTIPYPFGIGPGCYSSQGFDVSCEDNRTFMHNSSSRMEIYNISLLGGQQSVDQSGQCSGMGCCQTSIAPNLTSFNISFDNRYDNSGVLGFNPCSYAFVAEQDWFWFEASYLGGNKFTEKFKDGVPAVFDWVAGNQPCDAAVKNRSSYACISKNSQCVNSPNATGYLCNCTDGFEGNPYLEDGYR